MGSRPNGNAASFKCPLLLLPHRPFASAGKAAVNTILRHSLAAGAAVPCPPYSRQVRLYVDLPHPLGEQESTNAEYDTVEQLHKKA